jgi:secondary thiamine-phosphate synthase enzyme
MKGLEIKTQRLEELIDLTPKIQGIVSQSAVRDGLCVVFVPHTTAGITINENADPDVKTDIRTALRHAIPDSLPYGHGEGNSPAHVKASLVGSSVTVIVEEGRLCLGTWQGIQLCEFDGPRTRKVWVKIVHG